MKFTLVNPPCAHKTWEWRAKVTIACTECDCGIDMIDRDTTCRMLVWVYGPEPKYDPSLLPVCRLIYGIQPERLHGVPSDD